MYSYLKGKIVVSIHAPHEGERLIENLSAGFCQGLFQSTLPTRGSDLPLSSLPSSCLCFNPRSPRGGATVTSRVRCEMMWFQSTLPTRGSDTSGTLMCGAHKAFQSTLPTRGSDSV